jgi:hypothetical protein
MNDRPELELIVTDWLRDEAVSDGSDRVLAAALSTIEMVGQERRFPSVFGRLADADPAAHRRAALILTAALLASAIAAAAAGALLLWQRSHMPPGGLGTLAFVRQGDLYLASPDGTGAVAVAHVDGSPLSSPMWSPDGRWVAVQTPEPAILLFDTATMEMRRLTGGSISARASDLGPWRVGGWSPDVNGSFARLVADVYSLSRRIKCQPTETPTMATDGRTA